MSLDNVNLGSCPYSSSLWSYLGIACALSFSCLGSAVGIAKSSKGVLSSGILKPAAAMKNSLSCILAGVLGIYGLICGIVINTSIS